MADETVDVERAARLLFEFRKRNNQALAGVDLSLTILDFKHDVAVDDLCRRLAEKPDLRLLEEPREVRALLSVRLAQLIGFLILEGHRFKALEELGPADDRTVFAFLVGRVLVQSRLPATEDGRLFSLARPERLN